MLKLTPRSIASAKRFLGVVCMCLTAASWISLFSPPAQAIELHCCNCTWTATEGTGENLCFTLPQGKLCEDYGQNQLKLLSDGQYQFSCASMEDAACKRNDGKKAGAICVNDPIAVEKFRPAYIDQYLGLKAKAAAAAGSKAPAVPTLGIPIPGVSFPSELPREGEYIVIPYLAIYVAAIQKYATGLGLIAAAIMLVYGGFKYLLSATGAGVASAKDTIQDALVGLALLISSVVLMMNINPETVRPGTINIIYMQPVEFDKELGFYQLNPPPTEPWDPQRYDNPNAPTRQIPPVPFADSDKVVDLYSDNPDTNPYAKDGIFVRGDSPAKRMLSVCLPKDQQKSGALHNKSRDEQMKYAAAVMRVWMVEALTGGRGGTPGASYVRGGWTTVAPDGSKVLTQGANDTEFYLSFAQKNPGICPYAALTGTIEVGPLKLSCNEAYEMSRTGNLQGTRSNYQSFDYYAAQLANIANSSPQAVSDFVKNPPADYNQVLQLIGGGQQITPATTAQELSGMSQAISNAKKDMQAKVYRALQRYDTECNRSAQQNMKECYTKWVGENGIFAGDCLSTWEQYFKCIGMSPGNGDWVGGCTTAPLPKLTFNYKGFDGQPVSIEVGTPHACAPSDGDRNAYLFYDLKDKKIDGHVDVQEWATSMNSVGGPQFGDLYLTDCHNWMYVGGGGLKWNGSDVNWIEMGGGGSVDVGNPKAINGGFGKGGSPIKTPKGTVNPAGVIIRFGATLDAMSPGCGNQTTKPTEPIHVVRLFKDNSKRCNPQKDNCPNPADVCLGNGVCQKIEPGMVCYNPWTMGNKKPLECGKAFECRTCTLDEAINYGWMTQKGDQWIFKGDAGQNARAMQELPCWSNAANAYSGLLQDPSKASKTTFKYCMPRNAK